MPNSFQIKEQKWSMANTGGPTENLAVRKSHAFRNRSLSELRSEISQKCIQNLQLCHLFYTYMLRVKNSSSIRKVLSVTFFFMITATIGGCAFKTSVFRC